MLKHGRGGHGSVPRGMDPCTRLADRRASESDAHSLALLFVFVFSGQLLHGIVSPAFTSVVIYPHPCGDVEVVREEKHLRTESDIRRAIKAQDRDMRVSTPGGLHRRQIAVFGADRCSRDGLSVFCGSCCGLIVFVTRARGRCLLQNTFLNVSPIER